MDEKYDKLVNQFEDAYFNFLQYHAILNWVNGIRIRQKEILKLLYLEGQNENKSF